MLGWQTIVIAILGAIDVGFFIKWLFVSSERKKLTVEAQERENNGRKSGCDRRKPQQSTPMEYDPPTEIQQPMLSENAPLNNNDDKHD